MMTVATYDDVKEYLKTCSTKRLYSIQDQIFDLVDKRENRNFEKALKASQSKVSTKKNKQHA